MVKTLKNIFLFLVGGIAMFSQLASAASCAQSINPAVISALKNNGANLAFAPQRDYGKFVASATCYFESWPTSTAQVSHLVKIAYDNNIAIRTQGAGHSENGTSLPKVGELLIHTTQLNKIIFNKEGSILIGSGIPILLADNIVQANSSFFIPIHTSGEIGPTVGGFISAGGLGILSRYTGGFWEHVKAITLVTADGKILHLDSHNPSFLWLFGSMGQLGIVTEAELQVLSYPNKAMNYPRNKIITVTYPPRGKLYSNGGSYWQKLKDEPSEDWFSLFLPESRVKEGERDLNDLIHRFPQALAYYPIYNWPIRYFDKMPPLIYDKHEDFHAIGIAGMKKMTPESREQLEQLAHAFTDMVLQKHYQRYIQVESESSAKLYKDYFSPQTYAGFKALKQQWDPKFLFNSKSFFPQEDTRSKK